MFRNLDVSPVKFYQSNPLSLRILGYILAVSTFFAATASALQLWDDYTQDLSMVETRLSDAEQSLLPSLEESLWRLEEDRIELLLDSYKRLPYIAYTELETAEGNTYSAGSPPNPSQRTDVEVFALSRMMPDQREIDLGTLRIYVDEDAILGSLYHKALVILGTQGAKTFAVSLFILLILHLAIMRHLSSLAHFAERLSLDNLQGAFSFHGRKNRETPDELDKVAASINQMRLHLIEELEELNRAQNATKKLSSAIEASPAAMIIMDHEGRAEYANPAFTKLIGIPFEQALQTDWLTELSENINLEQGTGEPLLKDILVSKGHFENEVLWRNKAGTPLWLYINISPFLDETGQLTHYLLVMENLTILKEYQKKLIQNRKFDPLTNLPNRILAMEELGKRIETARNRGTQIAVMAVSIDTYRDISESLGVGFADYLLRECAEILNRVSKSDILWARSGEHEFLCIMPLSGPDNAIELLAKRLQLAFTRPIQLKDYPTQIAFHAGITFFPNDGRSAETLYKNAQTALNRARDQRARYQYYEPSMAESSFRNLRIASLLKTLHKTDEFQVFYQPIVTPEEGRPVCMEALSRWNSGELGFIPPPQFIELAEKTGDIITLGSHILKTACRQAQRWHEAGMPLSISVNVSPTQFRDDGFLDVVEEATESTGLPLEYLKLEITELLLLEGNSGIRNKAEYLVDKGVKLAIDDFGTGYSSLSYLSEFPFNVLKIDKSFVLDIDQNQQHRTLVHTIVNLAHNLGMEVIAEGVESEEHVKILRDFGCDLLQGFHYSKPREAQYFDRLYTPQGDQEDEQHFSMSAGE